MRNLNLNNFRNPLLELSSRFPKVVGRYIVGSRATGENRAESDIDNLVITDNSISPDEIREIQHSLRNFYLQNCPSIPVGVRIRSTKEIRSFYNKLLSWGFDLRQSLRLVGPDSEVIFEVSLELPTNEILFDNVIESFWYITLNRARNSKDTPQQEAKAILALSHFLLLTKQIKCLNAEQRVREFSTFPELTAILGAESEALIRACKIRKGDRSELQSWRGKEHLNASVYRRIFEYLIKRYSKSFERLEIPYDYWALDQTIYDVTGFLRDDALFDRAHNRTTGSVWREFLMSHIEGISYSLEGNTLLDPRCRTHERLLTNFGRRMFHRPSLRKRIEAEESWRIRNSKFGLDLMINRR